MTQREMEEDRDMKYFGIFLWVAALVGWVLWFFMFIGAAVALYAWMG